MIIRSITSTLIVLFSTACFAEDMNNDNATYGEQLKQDFIILDQDGNGLLDRAEVDAHQDLAGSFVNIDLNDSNDVDMDEFMIYRSEATAAGNPEKVVDEKRLKSMY